MFAVSNITQHRNTITEADYFVTHIINKETNAKIIQNEILLPDFS